MNSKDLEAISRQAWLMTEFSKTSTMQNITIAVAKGELKIDRAQLPHLLNIVQNSIEQGFVTSIQEFNRQVSVVANGSSKKK